MEIPFTTPDAIAAATDGEISGETVRRFCRAGRFPSAVQVGGRWLITFPEAEQFLKSYDRYKPGSIEIQASLGMRPKEST
jgi:hypothetical protein